MSAAANRAGSQVLARRQLRRLIGYLVIAGVAMVTAAILYLRRSGPLTGTLLFTVTVGVFVSIVLGGGLMALGFYSAQSGLDESVAGATTGRDDAKTREVEGETRAGEPFNVP